MGNHELPAQLPFDIIQIVNKFFETKKIPVLGENAYLYEGFCLYSAIVSLELKEDDFSFFNEKECYKSISRNDDIKKNLKLTKKYKNKTISEEEFENIIARNNLTDIRNSFAHGNFEIDKVDGQKLFVLTPPRPANITSIPLQIRFEDLYPIVENKFHELQKEMLKTANRNAIGQYFFKCLSLAYIEMAYFFSGKILKTFASKDWIIKLKGFILQHLISIHTSYSQNDFYPYLEAHPVLKNRLCIYRNSTIHANTVLEKAKFKFLDIDEKSGTKREITSSLKDFNNDLAGIMTIYMIELTKEIQDDLQSMIDSNSAVPEDKVLKYKAKIATVMEQLVKLLDKYPPNESEESIDDGISNE